MANSTLPEIVAKVLNQHHWKHCAGFYPSIGGRFFGARVSNGSLEITPDFGVSWRGVDINVVSFNDHNGKRIPLS